MSVLGFKHFITEKLKNYTPYILLKKRNLNIITKDEITEVLRSTFKQQYQDKTWETYSLYLIGWLLFSDIDIKSKIIEPTKGRGKSSKISSLSENYLPRNSKKLIVQFILTLAPGGELNMNIAPKYERDLFMLDIINRNRNLTDFGKTLIGLDEFQINEALLLKALEIEKLSIIHQQLRNKPNLKAKQLIEILDDDFFDGKVLSSKLIYASTAMSWLKSKSDKMEYQQSLI